MTRPTELHDESLLSPKQVTEWFKERGMAISVERVAAGINEGSIPGYRVGRWYVTPLPWLKRWLNGPGNDVATVPPANATVIPFLGRRQAS